MCLFMVGGVENCFCFVEEEGGIDLLSWGRVENSFVGLWEEGGKELFIVGRVVNGFSDFGGGGE